MLRICQENGLLKNNVVKGKFASGSGDKGEHKLQCYVK